MKTLLFNFLLLLTGLTVNGQDKPSIHGMLIFGKEKVYVSHLPMFHTPHNYQIILELGLTAKDKKKFVDDQLANPKNVVYTLVPERFVLPDMVKSPKPFKAVIYRGHFERGGSPISDSITVTIQQVVYNRRFDDAPKPLKTTNYLLFGNEKEQFATHFINKKPDFDDIRLIKATLPKNTVVTEVVIDDKKNVVPNNNSTAIIGKSKDGKTVQFSWLKQLYLEFEDLK
jgi:hypothetical protein